MMWRHVLLLGITMAMLLLWRSAPPLYQDWLLLPLWVGCSLLILLSNIEMARARRSVWLAQYLNKDSPWQQRLRYGLFGVLLQLLISITLAFILLIKLLILDARLILILLLGLPLMLLFTPWLQQRLSRDVKVCYQPVVARRLSVWLGTLLLGILLIAVLLTLPQPPMQGMGWSEAMERYLLAGDTPGMLGAMIRAGELLDLSQKWLLQNTIGDVQRSGLLALLIWLLAFSSYFALTLALTRLLAGAAIQAEHWQRKHHG